MKVFHCDFIRARPSAPRCCFRSAFAVVFMAGDGKRKRIPNVNIDRRRDMCRAQCSGCRFAFSLSLHCRRRRRSRRRRGTCCNTFALLALPSRKRLISARNYYVLRLPRGGLCRVLIMLELVKFSHDRPGARAAISLAYLRSLVRASDCGAREKRSSQHSIIFNNKVGASRGH